MSGVITSVSMYAPSCFLYDILNPSIYPSLGYSPVVSESSAMNLLGWSSASCKNILASASSSIPLACSFVTFFTVRLPLM